MKSFLSVVDSNARFVKCEVENVPMEGRQNSVIIWDCFVVDVPRDMFHINFPVLGDVYSCIHENGKILEICEAEPMEKERRIRFFSKLDKV